MYYVTPAEGELFQKFSPELQKRNLEMREQRQADYEDFVSKLKEYSKSDKPIWQAAEEAMQRERERVRREQRERGGREGRGEEGDEGGGGEGEVMRMLGEGAVGSRGVEAGEGRSTTRPVWIWKVSKNPQRGVCYL